MDEKPFPFKREKEMNRKPLSRLAAAILAFLLPTWCPAQVNSGSNGSDGAFNPTTNTVIDMADHPNGIYQYSSVNIPIGVTVSFIPNTKNTPVVWLVQADCFIAGMIDVSGKHTTGSIGALGGPGGYKGGNGGSVPSDGFGPGGGKMSSSASGGTFTYGNQFLLPLVGGSGGGGQQNNLGGAGGGGAILIAASGKITVGTGASTAWIYAKGGISSGTYVGGGSGGGIRLVASEITGAGEIRVDGGQSYFGAGPGRIRFDSPNLNFGGSISGAFSQGSQPIIIPTAGMGSQLAIVAVGGVTVAAPPTGQIPTPDAVLSAQQNNPIPIVVQCSNIPLNTQITITVKPANAPPVSATGINSAGTLSSSTATISINMPRGGGIIYATAAN